MNVSETLRPVAAVLLVGIAILLIATPTPAASIEPGRPFIHVTDLYRPHVDPDDHWDLACVYALACRGDIDLKGIVIDYPPAGRTEHDPDLTAVAQMNRITGLSVPVAVGSPHPMRSRSDMQPDAGASEQQAVRMMLNILRTSDRPVIVTVTGCCRDVAVAAARAPDLFARKCAAVYLNAGTGSPDPNRQTRPEYNVTLDRTAYAAMFELPCPLYWLPCFEGTESDGGPLVRQYASHYRFRQSDILPHLSEQAQNYFLSMLERHTGSDWLSSLRTPPDKARLTEFGEKDRHMWCTGGLLHAAGYDVTSEGRIVAHPEAGTSAVFSFDPIEVASEESGVTRWSDRPSSRNRFIFHVRNRAAYEAATTKAMLSLLKDLP